MPICATPTHERVADPRPLVGAMSLSSAAVAVTTALVVGLSLPFLQWTPLQVESVVESAIVAVLPQVDAVETVVEEAVPVAIEIPQPVVDAAVADEAVAEAPPPAEVETIPQAHAQTEAPPAPVVESLPQPVVEEVAPVVEEIAVVGETVETVDAVDAVETNDPVVAAPEPVAEETIAPPPAQPAVAVADKPDLETVIWDEDERMLFNESGVAMTIAGQARDRRLLQGTAPDPAIASCGDATGAVVVIRFEVRADGSVKNDAYYEQTASCREQNRSAMAAVHALRFAALPTSARAGQWAVATITFGD